MSQTNRVKDEFEGENMQTQCSVLVYIIDLYFHGYKLAIEVDALDLLILCLQIKLWLILLVCFLLMILKKKWQYNFEIFQRWMKAILFKQLIINLADQKKFRLSEISKTENYFN